jgi:hypothetical protein
METPLSRKAAKPEARAAWDAYIAHSCRSRTRLTLPDLKGRTPELTQLCESALQLAGVHQVEGRPLTGSLIVTHDGTADEFARAARKAGLLHVKGDGDRHELHADARALKDSIDRALQEAVGHGIDARALGGFAFLAIALRQLATGQVMPPAATALWYALNLIAPGDRSRLPGDRNGAG